VRGENFLEFKREQLIFQIKRIWNEYEALRKRFLKLYMKALIKLNQNYKERGKRGILLISKLSKIQYKASVNVQYKKSVGIIIPKINYEFIQKEKLPAYTFNNTSHYLDDLIIILKKLFEVIILFSEIEDLILKLSLKFKKINRRINGLKNLIIPRLEINIKQIKDILEEIQRESFVRLKKTKDLILKKQGEGKR